MLRVGANNISLSENDSSRYSPRFRVWSLGLRVWDLGFEGQVQGDLYPLMITTISEPEPEPARNHDKHLPHVIKVRSDEVMGMSLI